MPRDIVRTKPEADNMAVSTEETPTRERVTKNVEPRISAGWSSDLRVRSSTSKVARFSASDDGEETVIKFLDDQPFVPLFQHWVMTKDGRRAYTCAKTKQDPDICPMCNRGDKAKASDWFNVVVLTADEDGEPELQVWYASADPSSAIRERAEAKRTSPINRDGLYFAVSKKKGTNGFFSYSVDVVKEDELLEDWGLKPLTADQIAEFNANKYDSSIAKIHTISELGDIAKQYLDAE